MEYEKLTERVLGAATEVHRELGPGLLESTYEKCLVHELRLHGIDAERQVSQPIEYKGLFLDEGYRIDILVEKRLILELKVVESVAPLHLAQLLTYLKLSKLPLGYLLNFNVPMMKDGIKRVANNFPETS